MDASITRLLNDKIYDKRKVGALELERVIRELATNKDHTRVQAILEQLCNEYAYAIHQPHARNGGLIGLAAAAIALGPELPRYLEVIVPPVLACFTDQDARVRYYACEALYNIAKVAKGEILIYFNHIFDALCKLGADSELSVKNGAELLDRLIKDIVSESAATYVSVLASSQDLEASKGIGYDSSGLGGGDGRGGGGGGLPTAFSLMRFIPLLKQRIFVINPFTRTFLVGWIVLLDSIPDLELVTYLPEFLGGLLKFLSDPNRDVHVATQGCLDKFLSEIKRISNIKKGIAESKKSKGAGDGGGAPGSGRGHGRGHGPGRGDGKGEGKRKREDSLDSGSGHVAPDEVEVDTQDSDTANDDDDDDDEEDDEDDDDSSDSEDDWVPGQDVQINYRAILEILTATLDSPLEEDGLLESLRWIVEFLDICPEEVLPFTPKILAHLLPAMASGVESIRQAAARVNTSLMDYVVSLSDEPELSQVSHPHQQVVGPPSRIPGPLSLQHDGGGNIGNVGNVGNVGSVGPSGARPSLSGSVRDLEMRSPTPAAQSRASVASGAPISSPTPPLMASTLPAPVSNHPQVDLDYAAAVNSLTLLFLNDHEATRVAALTWLIMLHRKAPRKVLAFNDGTFPALLKTLSDPAEAVVTKDLQLLSQISRNSEDDYFSNFMVNLLQLFSTDRKLLETRGNLIIRQLCVSLSAERIYRTLADCIEKEEDVEFASIMVQILNNNLITAPELSELRKRLRNLETKDGQTFFVALFRSWCYNAVATFSLCLLAQAYEQAYNLLQIFAELEMTVNILIQIDKLVQLLESPVFTYLRLQLLEPEKYPHLYKCLYGLLMLLPQSSAFAALKNRLNSVSSIGYLHIAPRPYVNPMGVGGGGGASVPASATHSRQSSMVEAMQQALQPQLQAPPPRSSTSKYSLSDPYTYTGPTYPNSGAATPGGGSSNYERANRLKGREEGIIRWGELLEKFRSVQERARRAQRLGGGGGSDLDDGPVGPLGGVGDLRIGDGGGMEMKAPSKEVARGPPPVPLKDAPVAGGQVAKPRGLGRPVFSRLGGAVGGKGKRPQ